MISRVKRDIAKHGRSNRRGRSGRRGSGHAGNRAGDRLGTASGLPGDGAGDSGCPRSTRRRRVGERGDHCTR